MDNLPPWSISNIAIPVDYLDHVDEDITALFRNQGEGMHTHLSFEPLLLQLIKELRRNTDAVSALWADLHRNQE